MTPDTGQPWVLNRAVDGLVAAGRYAEALALPERFVVSGSRDSTSELLVQINLAEAEYNLGRWNAAWERLRGLDPLAAAFPIARTGIYFIVIITGLLLTETRIAAIPLAAIAVLAG